MQIPTRKFTIFSGFPKIPGVPLLNELLTSNFAAASNATEGMPPHDKRAVRVSHHTPSDTTTPCHKTGLFCLVGHERYKLRLLRLRPLFDSLSSTVSPCVQSSHSAAMLPKDHSSEAASPNQCAMTCHNPFTNNILQHRLLANKPCILRNQVYG